MIELTNEERRILTEVYNYQDPDTTLAGSNTEEKREILNLISVLRETPGGAGVKIRPFGNGEIAKAEALALAKVEAEGIQALDADERRYYAYYLATHSYKINAKGDATKPIHKAIADLVLLDMDIFILNGDAYIYNDYTGSYERDPEGKRVRGKIRSLLEFEFIEDKTINAIYNLITGDDNLTIQDTQINNRPRHWIHFTNGYYDYKIDSLRDHDPKYKEIGVIPWPYEPSRYPSNYRFEKIGSGILRETIEKPLFFDTWFEEAIPDPEDRKMLLQYIAYSMTLDTSAQKFIMLCGPGGTGKSTILSIISAILGRNNISSVALQDLQDRFTPGELYLKQANICADIPLTALSEVDMIKKLTGEDLISVDRKFKNCLLFKSYARLFFSANDIPVNLSDKTNAFYRRMLILKMDHKPEVVDPEIVEKIQGEIPNIITKALEEFYCSGGMIDESSNSKRLVKEAHKNSDTVEAFLDDRCVIDDKSKIDRSYLYGQYFNYCVDEERKSLTKSNFYKQLENKGFASRRGKTGSNVIGLKLSNIVTISGLSETIAR